jgi:hypothetical protein
MRTVQIAATAAGVEERAVQIADTTAQIEINTVQMASTVAQIKGNTVLLHVLESVKSCVSNHTKLNCI